MASRYVVATGTADSSKEGGYHGYMNWATWRIACEVLDNINYWTRLLLRMAFDTEVQQIEFVKTHFKELADYDKPDVFYDLVVHVLDDVDWTHINTIIRSNVD